MHTVLNPQLASGDIEDLLLKQIDRDELIELTSNIIAIESHRDAPGHETPVAVHIRDLLRKEGIEAELQEVRDGRCNVVGLLPGRGSGPRLMFNGHIDTVPPGQMERPFEPHVVDGYLHGRGTSDMKGGVASQLYAMIALKRAGIRLNGDLVLTGVIAEEDGTSLGSSHVIAQGPAADMVVVAEPSDLEVIVAHKGFDYYKIEVEGIPAHSSEPENGVSAIYKASRIVNAIEERLIPRTSTNKHALLGPASINVSAIIGYAKNEAATALRRGPGDKPAGATVPDACTIYLDRRRIPGETLENVLGAFEDLLSELRTADEAMRARVHFTPGCPELESHPPLDTDPDHVLVRECLRIASEESGRRLAPSGVPFWSDAALFNAYGRLPAIVFGPGHISAAHSNTERVPVDQLVTASRVNALLAASLLAAKPDRAG